MTSHLGQGLGPIAGDWSLYVLIGAGAASLLLASHALAAGPLAASQPGFTILDPLTAGLLGLFLFGEHIQTAPLNVAAEALALALLAGGATTLSHSRLLVSEDRSPADGGEWDCLSADCSAVAGEGPRAEEAELVPQSRTVRSG